MSNPFGSEGYNPFDGDEVANQAPAQSGSIYTDPAPVAEQPAKGGLSAITETISDAFSSVAGKPEFVDPVTGMPITEKQIADRERQLEERERMIREREEALANGTIRVTHGRKNFPPMLHWWSYHPDEDLPLEARKTAKTMFMTLLLFGPIYLINFLAVLFSMGCGDILHNSPAMMLVLSAFYLIALWPVSFEICYFPYYNSLISGKAMRFFCALGVYFLYFALLVFNVIGIASNGAIGIISVIDLFAAGKVLQGVFGIIFVVAGILDICVMVIVFISLIAYYKQEGLDKKAFAEAGQFAAEKAMENRELLAEAAMNNPGLVMDAVATAYSYENVQ